MKGVFIRPVPADEATGAVAEMYSADRAKWGFLPEFTQVFSHHPDAYAAWVQLIASVRGQMDSRRCELVTLAAAQALRSEYCATAHSKVLVDRWFDAAAVTVMLEDRRSAGLDDIDVVLMDFAAKVATDATSITEADIDCLRAYGLDDRDILDVVLAAAARCFFANVVEALAAGPDPQLLGALPSHLQEALAMDRRPL